jgi:hypothetical protein
MFATFGEIARPIRIGHPWTNPGRVSSRTQNAASYFVVIKKVYGD